MELNGINYDTYFNNYPDKNGYFGKYGGVYIDDKLRRLWLRSPRLTTPSARAENS
jgi:hypothetical protein